MGSEMILMKKNRAINIFAVISKGGSKLQGQVSISFMQLLTIF